LNSPRLDDALVRSSLEQPWCASWLCSDRKGVAQQRALEFAFSDVLYLLPAPCVRLSASILDVPPVEWNQERLLLVA